MLRTYKPTNLITVIFIESTIITNSDALPYEYDWYKNCAVARKPRDATKFRSVRSVQAVVVWR